MTYDVLGGLTIAVGASRIVVPPGVGKQDSRAINPWMQLTEAFMPETGDGRDLDVASPGPAPGFLPGTRS